MVCTECLIRSGCLCLGHDVDICSSHNDVDTHVTKQSLVVRPGHRPQYIELVDETNKLRS